MTVMMMVMMMMNKNNDVGRWVSDSYIEICFPVRWHQGHNIHCLNVLACVAPEALQVSVCGVQRMVALP